MNATNKRRIVILGKTGAGKSSVGNTIFGEDQFNVCHGSCSSESQCQTKTESLIEGEITLIDTPGFFDTNISEENLKPEILKCITECSPGLHAFLIVLKLDRFTEQENDIIKKITQSFTEEVFKFATVVFTHGDDLLEGQEIHDYLSPNATLSGLVQKCGGRCHVIDNKYWKNRSNETYRSNAYQLKEILKSVEEIVNSNNGNCYTNDFLQTVEEMIELSSENLSRQKAKGSVIEILNKFAGITTGMLLGAFFGAAAVNGKGAAAAAAAKLAITSRTATCATAVAAAGSAGSTALSAAAGAAYGAYKGYHAAEEAETPWDAAKETARALVPSGKDAIKKKSVPSVKN